MTLTNAASQPGGRFDPITRALAGADAWDCPVHAVAFVGAGSELIRHGATATVTRIASVTKALFAYAVLIAVEEGLFPLDLPVGPVGATVRHLLSHASGLPLDTGNATAPGTRRIYSNVGFELLGDVVEQHSGMSRYAYVSAAVFEPLGMTNSALATGSVARDATSTVDDLARFAAELLRPSLVDNSTATALRTPQFADLAGVLPGFGSQRPCPWGLGFEIRGYKSPHWTGTQNSPETFGHFGAAGSFLWVDPALDAGLVCLTGRDFGPWAAEAWPRFADDVIDAVTGSTTQH